MRTKGIIAEDFTNYKKPSMFIATCFCDWKCCRQAGLPESVCQNSPLAYCSDYNYTDKEIYDLYINNNISQSVVFGGLEPFMQTDEILTVIKEFRDNGCFDPIIIYTGYDETEISSTVEELKKYKNIYIKYGRYIPGHKKHFDEVLGVYLASDNQYGVKIS